MDGAFRPSQTNRERDSKESQDRGLTQGGRTSGARVVPLLAQSRRLIPTLDVVAQRLVEVVQPSTCIEANGKAKLCWRLANSTRRIKFGSPELRSSSGGTGSLLSWDRCSSQQCPGTALWGLSPVWPLVPPASDCSVILRGRRLESLITGRSCARRRR